MTKYYYVSINTPIGIKNGTLQLNIKDSALSGKIISNNICSTFKNDIVNNSHFSFKGIFYLSFLSVNYKVQGYLKHDSIKGTVHTKYGTFSFTGYSKS